MDTPDVARVLGQIAAFLELQGGNPFRIRAYLAAARAVAGFPGNLRDALQSGALAELKGVGPATLEIIEEVLTTGRSGVLDGLREEIPPGLVEMLQISGLGVAKVRQIHESLGITTLADLEDAARDGRLATLPRFGAKTAENILRGISFLRQAGGHRLFHHALDEARALSDVLRALPGVRRAVIAGSLRRHLELIRDLDFVIELSGRAQPLLDRLRDTPGVAAPARSDPRQVTLTLRSGTVAVIHLADDRDFGFRLVRATGSEDHIAALAGRASQLGLGWDGTEGLRHNEMSLALPTEEAVYETLNLQWIPPELREGTDEVAAAARHAIPNLVRREDLQGFLHCHSNYSDGTSTMADWAAASASAGYRYVGVTDHSIASTDAGGLAADAIARQHAEIDAVNRDTAKGVRILKGVEADILEDGSLDYTAAVRASFEFIIGSVHHGLGMDAARMTDRVLHAMDDPTMTILGHPTGRLLLSRDPFPLDLDRVFAKAAELGIAVEINADPQRLDLDWRVVRRAVGAGVTISLGADAHSTAGMSNMDIGIGIARKGWLTADHLLNARPAGDFLAFARRRAG